MGNIFKRKKKKNKGILLFVLGLTVFSIGFLIYSILTKFGKEKAKEPIEEAIKETIKKNIKETSKEVSKPVTPEKNKEIIASTQGDKYHNPSCRYAKSITKENIINFDTREDAEIKGYQPCGICH